VFLIDVSTCSSLSSSAGSPLNLPCYLGFIGKTGFESADENSDGSRSRSSRTRSISGHSLYSVTTAVVSDSEDEFPIGNVVSFELQSTGQQSWL